MILPRSLWFLIFLVAVVVSSLLFPLTSAFAAHHSLHKRRSFHRASKRWAMKSNFTDDSQGAGRLDSTASAQDIAELDLDGDMGVDMDEYCSVLDDFGCAAYEEGPPQEEEESSDEKVRLIRVQADADTCLQDVTSREDVWRKIREVVTTQSEHGRADLYERRWQRETSSDVFNDVLPINGEPDRSFSVIQFNALAEGLSSSPSIKTPFPCGSTSVKKSEKNCFGGFTAIKHPEVVLDFDKRRWRLLEIILGSCDELETPPFDLIALEEVDRYRGFFAPILKYFGYQGIFVPKIKAPGVRLGWYSDGCALFWKQDVFELVSERRMSYTVGNQVYILATLRHRKTGIHLVTAVTHLKAQKSASNEHIRCAQVAELLERVERERQRVRTGSEEVPVLILGDFNADPPSDNDKDSCVRLLLSQHNDSESEYSSAYPVDPPKPGFFTTWKTRGSKTVKRVIDYIFFSNLSCVDTLNIPDESEIGVDQLPGLRYPSDHLMIGAKFNLPTKLS